MSIASAGPALSVVMLCDQPSRHFRIALSKLRRQTAARQIELVLVTPSRDVLNLQNADLEDFGASLVLETGPFPSEGWAKAAGVHAATAPLVAFSENHSFPARDWAEVLLRRHQEDDFAAVGPVVENANPRRVASRGCYLVFYGSFATPRAPGEVGELPGNHSTYRRDLLLDLGPQLAEYLEAETLLHWQWTRSGRKLCHAPECRAWHMQPSHMAPAMLEYFLSSRVFADLRAADWSLSRRLLYLVTAPGMPFLRTWRAYQAGRAAGMPISSAAGSLPVAFAILCAGAAGEWLGLLRGQGNAAKRLVRFSSGRVSLYSPEDLEAAERL